MVRIRLSNNLKSSCNYFHVWILLNSTSFSVRESEIFVLTVKQCPTPLVGFGHLSASCQTSWPGVLGNTLTLPWLPIINCDWRPWSRWVKLMHNQYRNLTSITTGGITVLEYTTIQCHSLLDSGWRGHGSSPGRGYNLHVVCFVFSRKTLHSYIASTRDL